MKRLAGLLTVGTLLASAQLAHAGVVTEEYTGSQDVWEGDSYTFDFDLWNTNTGSVNDNAPGLTLTKDGVGAFGAWSSATLYLDFSSTDSDPESAAIDLDAWTFRIGGAADVLSQTLNFSRPFGNDETYSFSSALTAPQVNLLDNFGGGTLRLTATTKAGYANDFTLNRVGLRATTGSVSVPEPSMLSLLGMGVLAVGALAMGRRSRRETFSFV